MIEAGDQAPGFTLSDQHGDAVSLGDFAGKTVVVYFYSKANTPGCTTQACGIRDRRAEYEAAGAVVLGISRDPTARIAAFDSEHSLGFTLLSDEDHAVAEAYGVWLEKSMYGRKYMGVQRATFVVGPDGKVVHVIPKATPKTHDDQVLKVLNDLGALA